MVVVCNMCGVVGVCKVCVGIKMASGGWLGSGLNVFQLITFDFSYTDVLGNYLMVVGVDLDSILVGTSLIN